MEIKKAKFAKDYSRLGSMKFVAKRMHVPAPPFRVTVSCFLCGDELIVAKGDVMAVFVIGNEHVGYSCDGCLHPDEFDQMQRIRSEMQARTP